MSLKDMMAADVAAVFLNPSEFADSVSYNGNEIKAIIEFGVNPGEGNTFSSEGQAARAYFTVAEADVYIPESCDEIRVIDAAFVTPWQLSILKDVTWQVARIMESAGGMHRLECTANESAFRRL